MKPVLTGLVSSLVFSLVLAGCGEEYPCGWYPEADFEPEPAPDIQLNCDGPVAAPHVVASWRCSGECTNEGQASIRFELWNEREPDSFTRLTAISVDVPFAEPSGTVDLTNTGIPDAVSGTMTYVRTEDTPYVDIPADEIEQRSYASTIEVSVSNLETTSLGMCEDGSISIPAFSKTIEAKADVPFCDDPPDWLDVRLGH